MISLGRSGGSRTVCGGYDKILERAQGKGLKVLAGHGLTYRNVRLISDIPEIEELNIGHNIIARASLVGLERAVREMLEAMGRRIHG